MFAVPLTLFRVGGFLKLKFHIQDTPIPQLLLRSLPQRSFVWESLCLLNPSNPKSYPIHSLKWRGICGVWETIGLLTTFP